MENREGYKKTELGWIPEEWEYCKFEDLTIEHKQGYYTKDEYSKDGIYLIRITDLQNPTVNFTNMPRLNIDEITFEQFKVETEDFLFARSGAIGRYGIISSKSPKAVFASYIIRFRFDKQKILNSFIGSFYSSQFCIRQLNSITQGSSNININANNIKSLMLPLPPLPEQQKIASILTTVDDKISSIEAQIQQTEQLKKGLMAKLLTEGIGHTEFKDTEIGRIPKGWSLKQFDQVLILQRGYDLPVQKRITGKYALVASNGVIDCHNEYKETGPGIVTGRSGTIGKVHYIVENYWPLNTTLFSKEMYGNHPKYLFYFLIELKIERFGTGTGVPTLNRNNVHHIKIPLPPLPEQQQIASILSSVDDKLDVLQSKKTSYTTLKKGLMAKLLTGQMRVRL